MIKSLTLNKISITKVDIPKLSLESLFLNGVKVTEVSLKNAILAESGLVLLTESGKPLILE